MQIFFSGTLTLTSSLKQLTKQFSTLILSSNEPIFTSATLLLLMGLSLDNLYLTINNNKDSVSGHWQLLANTTFEEHTII